MGEAPERIVESFEDDVDDENEIVNEMHVQNEKKNDNSKV